MITPAYNLHLLKQEIYSEENILVLTEEKRREYQLIKYYSIEKDFETLF